MFQGSPGLDLLDERGMIRWRASVRSDGSPNLTLLDEKGKLRWTAVVHSDGAPCLSLWDEKARIRWHAAVENDGAPSLSLRDRNGAGRAILGATSLTDPTTGVETSFPENTLLLYGPDGKILERLPR
jgi:hypothetical protein